MSGVTDLYEHFIYNRPISFDNFPLLDPNFSKKNKILFKRFFKLFIRLKNPLVYRRYLNNILNPIGVEKPHHNNLEKIKKYMQEADTYLDDIIALLPSEYRDKFILSHKVRYTNDLYKLLEIAFNSSNQRESYEAQRKLALTKYFFEIDSTRNVHEGYKHKEFFINMLEKYFWLDEKEKEETIYYKISDDGVNIEILPEYQDQEGVEFFPFKIRKAQIHFNNTYFFSPIDIYHYRVRFKREYSSPQILSQDVKDVLTESAESNVIHRRMSSSILSKMIRKGIDTPLKINDVLGVMFIVKDKKEVYKLSNMLETLLGGPINWGNVLDTVFYSGSTEKEKNKYTGRGYEVFKVELKMLYPNNIVKEEYYMFSVEIQIYTIEGYFRTIHSSHFANHRYYKKKQIVFGVLPYVFPEEIYGKTILQKILNHFIYTEHVNTRQYQKR